MKAKITKEEALNILKEEGEDLLSIWEMGFINNYNNDGTVTEEYASWNEPTKEEMEKKLLEETIYFFDEEENKFFAENEITGFGFFEKKLQSQHMSKKMKTITKEAMEKFIISENKEEVLASLLENWGDDEGNIILKNNEYDFFTSLKGYKHYEFVISSEILNLEEK